MADPRSAPDLPPSTAASHLALSGASLFDAVLAVRPCARSPHFYVHYLPMPASIPPVGDAASRPSPDPDRDELSTGSTDVLTHPVDGRCWRLGMIVPKRHAKRSVTRTLVKRRIRTQWRERLAMLPPGDWVVRLMTPLDRTSWPSAASGPLARMLSAELAEVLEAAARRARQGPLPARKPRAPGKTGKDRADAAAPAPPSPSALPATGPHHG